MIKRQIDRGAVFYYIRPGDKIVQFSQADSDDLYTQTGEGFVRKAIFEKVQKGQIHGRFVDEEFQLQAKSGIRNVRLYDFYKKQIDLFPYNQTESSYIHPQSTYNSFMGESGIINYEYLKTLFITQTVNEKGYYQYFVKRDGEYYVQECDDLIPVDKATWKPLWGLSTSHPWQLMLLKVWLKECGSMQNLYSAQPFRFLEAFGLAEYKVFNFRKEINFIKGEKVTQQQKNEKRQSFALNNKDVTIIAQTVNNPAIAKLGLIPNSASYKLIKVSDANQQGLYQLHSTLPCYWVGSHTAPYNTALNNVHNNRDMSLDLERNFLISEKEVNTYFNKFYVAPNAITNPKNLRFQDSISIKSTNQPIWIKMLIGQVGMLGISVELPRKRITSKAYPEFRYFVAKRNDEQDMSRSHFREDIAGSKLEQNMYVTSSCDKWQYYRIDYVQGYSNHAGSFSKVVPGEYVLYIDVDVDTPFKVRFDSHVRMEEPQRFIPTTQEAKQIFDSTFFSISRENGVEATFNQNTFEESIALNNSFDQIGYGSICIKTLQKAKHKVAMRVYPERLKQAGYRLLSHYDELQQDENRQKNFVFVSSKGKPEIVVLERTVDRNKTSIGQVFPPAGTVQFFKVTPNNVLASKIQSIQSIVK